MLGARDIATSLVENHGHASSAKRVRFAWVVNTSEVDNKDCKEDSGTAGVGSNSSMQDDDSSNNNVSI